MSIPNYNGKQPNNSAYIKNFVYGAPVSLWKIIRYTIGSISVNALTPASENYDNVYIPGDLYVDGSIINPSDIHLKENIENIDTDTTNKLLNLCVSQFNFKNDPTKKTHYGFIAQEFEKEYSELVTIKPDNTYANIKAINYIEVIPLLVNKIQLMQEEINELKEQGKLHWESKRFQLDIN